jgi:hypothetical protein
MALSSKSDSEFHRISEGVTLTADKKAKDWSLNEDYLEDTVDPLRDRWREKYAANVDPLTKSKLTAGEKEDARSDYEPVVGHLIEELRNNPAVSDDDLRSMDIYIPPHGNKPLPPTTEMVTFKVETAIIRRLVFHAHSTAGGTGKPHGVGSLEFIYAFLKNPPEKLEELTEREFHSRNTFLIDFNEEDRGKAVYFCARWIMRTMEHGPWGQVHFSIVP